MNRVKKAFAEIVPGVTKNRDVGVTVFRRRGTGVSQRGRTPGHEDVVIQGGDIVAAPSQGMFAYVLREGETEPPPDIQKLWAEYREIDRDSGRDHQGGNDAPRDRQELHGEVRRGRDHSQGRPAASVRRRGTIFPPTLRALIRERPTSISTAMPWGKVPGSRKFENYFGPRIGSNGPEWMWDIPLPPNHHFVLEYFIYMPWPSSEHEDQYLFWWNHEQALATENGVEYLSPPQEELYLISSE